MSEAGDRGPNGLKRKERKELQQRIGDTNQQGNLNVVLRGILRPRIPVAVLALRSKGAVQGCCCLLPG